jgi:hypothetical protein
MFEFIFAGKPWRGRVISSVMVLVRNKGGCHPRNSIFQTVLLVSFYLIINNQLLLLNFGE